MNKGILITTGILVSFIGCVLFFALHEKAEDRLQWKLVDLIESGGEASFRSLTDFEWDRVHIIGPYGDFDESSIKGIPRSVAARIDAQKLIESWTVLIFSKDNAFVTYEEVIWQEIMEVGLKYDTAYSPETILRKTDLPDGYERFEPRKRSKKDIREANKYSFSERMQRRLDATIKSGESTSLGNLFGPWWDKVVVVPPKGTYQYQTDKPLKNELVVKLHQQESIDNRTIIIFIVKDRCVNFAEVTAESTRRLGLECGVYDSGRIVSLNANLLSPDRVQFSPLDLVQTSKTASENRDKKKLSK